MRRSHAAILLAGSLLLSPACSRGEAREPRDGPPAAVATIALANVVRPAPAPSTEASPASPAEPTCPSGMVLVEGEHCPEVEQPCLAWMDPPSSRYHQFRCARYAPSVCKSKARVPMRFCIDVTERVDPRDEQGRPLHHMSWTSSKKLCEAEGARLCRESEWIFACEGEEMRPYPYGYERDPSACNADRSENIGRPGRLVDHRAPAGAHPKCESPFGVRDLAGNVEEWVQADGRGKMGWKEVLKGSWWIPSRHACRQFQVGHDDVYQGAETGTRCCAEPLTSTSSSGSKPGSR